MFKRKFEMKKVILYCVTLTLFVVSCKKEHKTPTPTPDTKKYQVAFNVSTPANATSHSVNNPHVNSIVANAVGDLSAIDNLYYAAYDSDGNLVSNIYQTSDFANFGQISDSLPSGTYTIVIVGGKTGINFSYGGNATKLNTAVIAGYGTTSPPLPWNDTFFKKFSVTVSGSSISQDVTLSRIVGQLTVDIQDALPANASKLIVSISKEYTNYTFAGATPSHLITGAYVQTITLPASALGTTDYEMSTIMINTITPFDVQISCVDANNTFLGQVTVTGVTLSPNTQTILSGKLFGTDNGFSFSLNEGWNPTITVHY